MEGASAQRNTGQNKKAAPEGGFLKTS